MTENNYQKFGFVHTDTVISQNEVDKFRRIIQHYSLSGKTFPLPPKFCLQDKEIMRIVFSPKLVSALKSAFHPDYIMFPDLEVQYNLIGGAAKNGIFNGWHVDSNSEGIKEYLTKCDYGFAKVGVYFQDNDCDYAGGIDLVPSSHRFIGYGPLEFRFLIKKLTDKLRILLNSKKIETKRGEALIFDSRLQHRSSRVKSVKLNGTTKSYQSSDFVELPSGHEKVVIYFDVAFPNSFKEFWINAKNRSKSDNEIERRHFSGYTCPEGDYDLFKECASETSVRTIFDITEI
jgi:hypothetical protein